MSGQLLSSSTGDLGQISFNLVVNAFAAWQLTLLAIRIKFYNIQLGSGLFLLFFSFYCSDWPSTGLNSLLAVKNFDKESWRKPIFTTEQLGVVAGNFALSFPSFLAFLCISQAPLGRSLWSRHWKDLFLLQKLIIDDANFGQKWWRQKWKKGQGSSRVITGDTEVNGLIYA